MGADMIIAAQAAKRGTMFDFEAGRTFISNLEDSFLTSDELVVELTESGGMFEEEEGVFDTDVEDGVSAPVNPDGMRRWLTRKVDEFSHAINGRACAVLSVRDLNVFIVGGMSWGDMGEEQYVFNAMDAVPGLLEAIGFEPAWWDEDKSVTPEEEAQAIKSITGK